jgi:hypothetical protein
VCVVSQQARVLGVRLRDVHYPLSTQENIMAHVILFEYPDFRGNHKHVFQGEPNLNSPFDDFMNDKTEAIVVLEGEWEFFIDWEYQKPIKGTLGPGLYPNIRQTLGDAAYKSISSLRPVTPRRK